MNNSSAKIISDVHLARAEARWGDLINTLNAIDISSFSALDCFEIKLNLIQAHYKIGNLQEVEYRVSQLWDSRLELLDIFQKTVQFGLAHDGFTWIGRLWERLAIASEVPVHERLRASNDLFRRYSGEPNRVIFVRWMLNLKQDDDGFVGALHVLSGIIGNEDIFPGAAAALKVAYDALSKSAIDPVMRAVVGPKCDDTISASFYAELVRSYLPKAAKLDWTGNPMFCVCGAVMSAPDFALGFQAALLDLNDPSQRQISAEELLFTYVISKWALPEMAPRLEILARYYNQQIYETPASAKGVWARILSAKDRTGINRPAILRNQPKVCLVISGQLRGYKAAKKTWERFGLNDENTVTVCHTWNRIGINLPHEIHYVDRTFSGAFRQAYSRPLQDLGFEFIKSQYSHLITAVSAQNNISSVVLKEFYNTDAVVVEDDTSIQFKDRSNPWKMYYKIAEAHDLAIREAGDCDIFVRIRPDFTLTRDLEIDWPAIARSSRLSRTLYVDYSWCFPTGRTLLWIDDQLAIGGRDAMGAYAEAFHLTEMSKAGEFFGYPDDWHIHSNVAYSTLYSGIDVRAHPALGGHTLTNPPAAPPSTLLRAIEADIASRPPNPYDHELIAALKHDIFNINN